MLAGDGRIVLDQTITSDRTRKVWRLKDGTLFGACGEVEGGELLKRALNKHEATPKLDGVAAIMVTPEGILFEYEGSTWVKAIEPYTAIGSGASYALAAMDFGASAVDAVRGSCRRHINSGGRIFKVQLTKADE